ncbi:hypothetical protein SPOG_03054 [Schizosaccharomyces cryophilus OY26]|uniref:Uncharacterized protein n=1 Tax=Schizosaccharomyces cryophilus (strain OY26 / ATCC MYA-4695 / CBS 11777 / NBRC 106824 / NRRL Y48691) TaxID=653667 RepID=S9W172_SCHCR|nr:uncharacterized protein SPOG_03054 [Schizosaccharomyces cryophilus OY26]EPY53713.1 hypothetical protein SPOG_03054 [Schizosaccharomyces cryophilus OY26]
MADREAKGQAMGYALSEYASETLCYRGKGRETPNVYTILPGFILANYGEILPGDFFWICFNMFTNE